MFYGGLEKWPTYNTYERNGDASDCIRLLLSGKLKKFRKLVKSLNGGVGESLPGDKEFIVLQTLVMTCCGQSPSHGNSIYCSCMSSSVPNLKLVSGTLRGKLWSMNVEGADDTTE